ncbi:hypothetical protein AB5J49_00475 [Streptomyces sp. R28]|uniref:Uncharacterized protein n=1 Tax=Streptomyces sp. R28 TaxID=3238628 RepID=A0AB39PPX4_9ACTN
MLDSADPQLDSIAGTELSAVEAHEYLTRRRRPNASRSTAEALSFLVDEARQDVLKHLPAALGDRKINHAQRTVAADGRLPAHEVLPDADNGE